MPSDFAAVLTAVLGFAQTRQQTPELGVLRAWLDSSPGIRWDRSRHARRATGAASSAPTGRLDSDVHVHRANAYIRSLDGVRGLILTHDVSDKRRLSAGCVSGRLASWSWLVMASALQCRSVHSERRGWSRLLPEPNRVSMRSYHHEAGD